MDPRFAFIFIFISSRVASSVSNKLAKVKLIFKELFHEYAKLNLLESTQKCDDMDMGMETNDPLSD